MDIEKKALVKKVFALEFEDDFRNVGDAFKLMKTLWQTLSQSETVLNWRAHGATTKEKNDTYQESRTFHIQISIHERGTS
jgi:hypothetical protein